MFMRLVRRAIALFQVRDPQMLGQRDVSAHASIVQVSSRKLYETS